MRFRGGGVGHMVTREWDELLQREGREAPLDDENVGNDLKSEDSDDELAWDVGVGTQAPGDGMDEEGEALGNSDSDGSEGEEDDIVIADDGEELDEDLWAQEGYGSL